MMLRLSNICNGLPYPHDMVCNFMSTHGHHKKDGYFRMDAMPYDAVICLLRGGAVTIIDATQHNKPLTDALKYGVPTWCLMFNRALRCKIPVCPWMTQDMVDVANGPLHRPLVQRVRRLEQIFGNAGPIEIGKQVMLECYKMYIMMIRWRNYAR